MRAAVRVQRSFTVGENRRVGSVRGGRSAALRRNIRRTQQKMLFLIVCCLLLIFAMSFGFALTSQAQDQEERVKYYTSIEIQPGDTLWEIADAYASPEYHSRYAYIEEVKEINHLMDDQITAGSYLTIPYYAAP